MALSEYIDCIALSDYIRANWKRNSQKTNEKWLLIIVASCCFGTMVTGELLCSEDKVGSVFGETSTNAQFVNKRSHNVKVFTIANGNAVEFKNLAPGQSYSQQAYNYPTPLNRKRCWNWRTFAAEWTKGFYWFGGTAEITDAWLANCISSYKKKFIGLWYLKISLHVCSDEPLQLWVMLFFLGFEARERGQLHETPK